MFTEVTPWNVRALASIAAASTLAGGRYSAVIMKSPLSILRARLVIGLILKLL
jgi:hypothetical protein